MESDAVLKEALVLVRRALKERGFVAKGTTFYCKNQDGNLIIFSVQKSVKSTPTKSEVTLNYGVYSPLISKKLEDDLPETIDVNKAQWRKRLNDGKREKWLPIAATDSPIDCAQAILSTVENLLPDLFAHSTNAALRDEWLGGVSPGLTDMQRLLYAAIVVNEIGPVEKVRTVVTELRSLVAGSIHEGFVERQLAKAGVLATR